jgi:hypothetical protein
LKTASRELAKHKLDLVGVQEVRWDKGSTEPTDKYTFLYGILRGCWCDIIVLNVHAPVEDKYDDTKDSLYEEIQYVFDQFPSTT